MQPLDDAVDVGIDVISPAGAPSDAAVLRLGRDPEIVALGIAGTLAAKEAATKVIGGRPLGSSLLDIDLDVEDVEVPPRHALTAMLADLGVGTPTIRPWRFGLAAHLAPVVGRAGGCPSGHGVVGTTAAGHFVALCLGQAGAAT